jgi:sugar lactone lactonase YvrE
MPGHGLSVLDSSMRWRAIDDASDARAEARRWNAARFKRVEDMETLPDGRIAMAENDTGKILVLTDHGAKASIETLLQDARITHPDSLAWDTKRHLLWITDNGKPSTLWTWDGHQARRIALHKKATITGVLPVGDNVFINLQANKNGPDLTMRLFEHRQEDTGS